MGITWTGCTTVDEPADNPQPWCITQTDAYGYPLLDGNGQFTTWGYCHSSCPIDQGLKLFDFFIKCLTIFSEYIYCAVDKSIAFHNMYFNSGPDLRMEHPDSEPIRKPTKSMRKNEEA